MDPDAVLYVLSDAHQLVADALHVINSAFPSAHEGLTLSFAGAKLGIGAPKQQMQRPDGSGDVRNSVSFR